MNYIRITKNLVEIDGETYMKFEAVPHIDNSIKDHIALILRKNGKMSHGVLMNRCRKWHSADVDAAISDMLKVGAIDGTVSLHPRTSVPVHHYALP